MNERSGVGGETALAAAAAAGQADALRWLLRRGCDAALQDDRHATPLDKARCNGHAACVQARTEQSHLAVLVCLLLWHVPRPHLMYLERGAKFCTRASHLLLLRMMRLLM